LECSRYLVLSLRGCHASLLAFCRCFFLTRQIPRLTLSSYSKCSRYGSNTSEPRRGYARTLRMPANSARELYESAGRRFADLQTCRPADSQVNAAREISSRRRCAIFPYYILQTDGVIPISDRLAPFRNHRRTFVPFFVGQPLLIRNWTCTVQERGITEN
jgi:hypothetical protein